MLSKLSRLTLRSGFLFRRVFVDPEICEEFVKILLGDQIGPIHHVEVEHDSRAELPENRGVRFDVFVNNGKEIIVVEMQGADHHNLPARSRIYLAHQNVKSAMVGDKYFQHVKAAYLIFICTFDPGFMKRLYTSDDRFFRSRIKRLLA